jgi:hypothetical protein
MDYYMGVDLKAPRHVKKRLYLAVIKGDVRAPLNGRIPGREWSKQIAAMNLTTTPSHCRPILNCLSRTLVDHGYSRDRLAHRSGYKGQSLLPKEATNQRPCHAGLPRLLCHFRRSNPPECRSPATHRL